MAEATQQGTATCPPKTANGTTFVDIVSNGSLTLSSDVLRISFDDHVDLSGALNGSCTSTLAGILNRQP